MLVLKIANYEIMKKQKKYKATIELYINDKLYKSVHQDKWDIELTKLSHLLSNKGYVEQYDNMPGFKHPDDYSHVWINWKSLKIVIVSHKARTIFTDKNGNILYEDDIVDYNGLQSRFHAKPFDDGYYVREVFNKLGGDWWKDTNIDETNINLITKITDVNNFPQEQWNQPELFDIKTL